MSTYKYNGDPKMVYLLSNDKLPTALKSIRLVVSEKRYNLTCYHLILLNVFFAAVC